MSKDRFDVAVIGGGIGGATAACHIAPSHSLVLLEQENELAYHTTSRSAAVFLESDGGRVFHRLNAASRPFLDAMHPELDAPLLDPLPVLNIGDESMREALKEQIAEASALTPGVRLVEGNELYATCPVLDPAAITVGMIEEGAASLDVMALHQLYVRRAVAAGADIQRSARVTGINELANGWRLTTAAGVVEAGVIVNAAGAWGDGIATMAGVQPIGLTPMRRTAFTARVDQDPSSWPLVYAPVHDRHCYFKPEAGNQLLCSLADETPSEPIDAKPLEIDVARAIDNINALTTLELRSVTATWAGLRTFAPDRVPVFGVDDANARFVWMVGQGGWGIVSSPAAGLIAGAAVRRDPFPAELASLGLVAEDLLPRR